MIPYRIARELVYQLDHAHQQEWLAKALSTIPMFAVLYQGETREEVLVHWKKLTDAAHNLVESYRRSIDMYRSEGESDEAVVDALKKLYYLLEAQGYWPMAEEMMRELLDVARHLGDRMSEGFAHRTLGVLAMRQGHYDEAMKELERTLAIAQETGDRLTEADAIGNAGIVHDYRGEYDRALECYERQRVISEELQDRRGLGRAIGAMGIAYSNRGEYDRALEYYERHLAICEELGDRQAVSVIMGNIGLVYSNRRENDRALACYEHCRTICEELGDRRGLGRIIGNMGIVYWNRYEYDRALECYERQRAISEELGDRPGVGRAIGNMGIIYSNRGEYDRALECYERQRAICEELGDRRGLYSAIGNMGGVYLDRREYDRALECYRMALDGHRAIGYLYGVSYWLYRIAQALLEVMPFGQEPSEYLTSYILRGGQVGAFSVDWREAALVLAREYADESFQLYERLGMPEMLFDARLLLARIDAAEGKSAAAIEQIESMLAEATDDMQRAEVHYWLWKTSARQAGSLPGPLSVDGEGEEERRGEYGEESDRTTDTKNDRATEASTSPAPLSAGGEGLGGTPGSGLRSRAEALRLYEELLLKMPIQEYRNRIEELATGGVVA